MEDAKSNPEAEKHYPSSLSPISPANSQLIMSTDPAPYADDPESTSTTDFSSPAVEGIPSVTLKPSVRYITESDTEYEELLIRDISGEDDLAEALHLPYEYFLKWAALRNQTYRQAVSEYAAIATSTKDSSARHPKTVAEAEWMAESMTDGITKAYPHEAPLIQIILEDKKNARH